jgi:hypothetical protein
MKTSFAARCHCNPIIQRVRPLIPTLKDKLKGLLGVAKACTGPLMNNITE